MYVGSHESFRAGLVAFFVLKDGLTDSDVGKHPRGQSGTKGFTEIGEKIQYLLPNLISE